MTHITAGSPTDLMASTRGTTHARPIRLEEPESPSIDLRSSERIRGGLIAFVIFMLLMYFAGRVFLLAFAGLLLAVFLHGVSCWLMQHTPLTYRWSLTLVVVTLVTLTGLAVWRLQSVVSLQVNEFSQAFPSSLEAARQRLEGTPLQTWIPEQIPIPSASKVVERTGMWSSLTGIASGTLSLAVDVLVILFVGLFGAAEPDLYQRGCEHLVPRSRRPRAREVLHSVGRTLRWWIVGKLCSMAIVGVTIGMGLWLLEINLALLLGLIAALFELVPNFGPILASVPAILIAWAASPETAFYVIALFVAVQLAESYLILPLIQRKTVETPPALVILAIVLMAMLGGTLGALVATPLLAALIVLIKMLYVEDLLNDQDVSMMGEASSS